PPPAPVRSLPPEPPGARARWRRRHGWWAGRGGSFPCSGPLSEAEMARNVLFAQDYRYHTRLVLRRLPAWPDTASGLTSNAVRACNCAAVTARLRVLQAPGCNACAMKATGRAALP